MNELSLGVISVLMSIMSGIFLGLIFYGGLWWTVQKGMKSTHTGIWFLTSFIVRMGLVIVGFCIMTDLQLIRILACLVGFTMVRLCVTRLSSKRTACLEADHAPES